MEYKSIVMNGFLPRALTVAGILVLAACGGGNRELAQYTGVVATPTVDYVESLDVYSAPHQDPFLNQLAMNYRSYAIYNARTSGYAGMGELFADKTMVAFTGDTPYPESVKDWVVEDEQEAFELYAAYNDLMDLLKKDVAQTNPELAAEAQAKFDCWLTATASGQLATAGQCKDRFNRTLLALRDGNGSAVVQTSTESNGFVETTTQRVAGGYYPETRDMKSVRTGGQAREGLIIVNNVNVPESLVNPAPVQPAQPMVFNQNIYGGDKTITKSSNDNSVSNSGNSLTVGECPVGDVACRAQQNAPSVAVVITEKDQPVVACPMCDVCSTCVECLRCQECQKCPDCPDALACATEIPVIAEELVTRNEMMDIMANMREEIKKEHEATVACPMCATCSTCSECMRCQECQKCPDCSDDLQCAEVIPMIGDELVTRDEFINIMMEMREELKIINSRLDKMHADQSEKTMIKVQQIPLEPTQHVMEEVFEVRFDFNKSIIKPEYKELIKHLVEATQENKNIKISVVGHTDTSGTSNYNYALGGRRAEAVQKMLIEYGVPASQIVAVSAGEEDLAVPTPDNTRNAENRRVRVVKEVPYTEKPKIAPVEIEVAESVAEDCGGDVCK
ncbi:MAG: OmpA family protein [Alphaproteobacteria bacterium]|nr:OmpA family protein [Alphaproteobacteria bacterium]